MKRLLLFSAAVALTACGDLTAPHRSGYGVPNAGDPSDTIFNKPNRVPRLVPHVRAGIECFSGYVIAYGDTTCA